jgi:hypothetical protein
MSRICTLLPGRDDEAIEKRRFVVPVARLKLRPSRQGSVPVASLGDANRAIIEPRLLRTVRNAIPSGT